MITNLENKAFDALLIAAIIPGVQQVVGTAMIIASLIAKLTIFCKIYRNEKTIAKLQINDQKQKELSTNNDELRNLSPELNIVAIVGFIFTIPIIDSLAAIHSINKLRVLRIKA